MLRAERGESEPYDSSSSRLHFYATVSSHNGTKNVLTSAETVTSETTEKMREERETNIIKFTCEWLGDDDC